MPTTLPRTGPITLYTIPPDIELVCLLSLLGLTLSAAVLSNVSSETIGIMLSYTG
jgi:hypothetical protein